MVNFCKRIIEYCKARFLPIEILGNPTTLSSPQVKEDTRSKHAIKRFRKSFKQQQDQMQARALKPHDATCKDPLMCKQEVCFKRVPDKIVSKPYKVNHRMRKKALVQKK